MTYKEIKEALNKALLATIDCENKAGLMTDDESQMLYARLETLHRLSEQAMEAIEMREAYL